MKAIHFLQREHVRRPGDRSFNHLRAPLSRGREEEESWRRNHKVQAAAGVNNDTVVSGMTEVRVFLRVCRPHSQGSASAVYLHEPIQNLKDEKYTHM